MYTVKKTGKRHSSFMAAVHEAASIGSIVFDEEGITRWSPPPVSARRIRQYKEQLAANEVQMMLNLEGPK